MADKPYKPVFHEGWFFNRTFQGFGRTMHGDEQEQRQAERAFFNELVIYLLNRQRSGGLEEREIFSFYGYCQRMLERSRSQILQDLWVLYKTAEKREGYFVEFGACDGRLLSNTFLLEQEFGWSGILAEPNPVWHEGLSGNRNCAISRKCVHWTSGGKVAFESTDDMPELSRLKDIVPDDIHEKNGNRSKRTLYEVDTITLNDLLDEHGAPGHIDYISVDTEGSEAEILEAFDFDRRSVFLFTVEHAGETAKRERIRELMKANGFHNWRPGLSRWDDWFVNIKLSNG